MAVICRSINDRWKDIKVLQYALHRAAGAGIVDAILPLVEAGQEIQGEDTRRLTPLYYACEGGYIEIWRLLIKFGANVNAQGGYYGNALQVASSGCHEVVKPPVENGADVKAQGGEYGNCMLYILQDQARPNHSHHLSFETFCLTKKGAKF